MESGQTLSPFLKQIGERLQREREQRNIQLDDAAETAEVLPAELEQIEEGNKDYSVYVLLKLAQLYQLDVKDLFP